ncbi:MAG TPA: exosome complex RNA-binding protein Csl4 [Nitrosopumilaceae archaeon]|nr:exosome complex RNA-binding protein Csl4 [Nitrosopumilaceae archaeon]
MSEKFSLPGDKIATIEEFETGDNTFDDGHTIRSVVVGSREFDKTNRIAKINRLKSPAVPQVNDLVIGNVAALMNNMFAVTMLYINGKPTHSGLECICQAKGAKKRIITRVSDIVMVKVISHLNGAIHATISEPDLGVLFTQCNKCAGKVVPLGGNVKCVDCGYIEERKLSSKFGNGDFIKLGSK